MRIGELRRWFAKPEQRSHTVTGVVVASLGRPTLDTSLRTAPNVKWLQTELEHLAVFFVYSDKRGRKCLTSAASMNSAGNQLAAAPATSVTPRRPIQYRRAALTRTCCVSTSHDLDGRDYQQFLTGRTLAAPVVSARPKRHGRFAGGTNGKHFFEPLLP
jgi:hypothetical protein